MGIRGNFRISGDVYVEVQRFLEQWFDDKDYVLAYTSGSTGKPKEIRLLKADMVHSACSTNRFFNINRNSVLACPLSASYIAGKMMIVRALMAGANLRMEKPSNNPLQKISGNYDLIAVVPSQLENLLKNNQLTIKNLLIGGAPLSEDQEFMVIKSGINGWVSYGMTETCSHVALRKIGMEGFYKALHGYSFEIDGRNCLIINSENMSFIKLTTNDIVELIDKHNFRWLGRYDNVINSGGIKVYPEIIEKKIAHILRGHNYYISRKKNDKWGESPVLYIEGEISDINPVQNEFATILEPAERPSEIIFIKEFSRTSSGKIIRQF